MDKTPSASNLKPPPRSGIGLPPPPDSVRGNLQSGPKETQLNVRLDPAKHAEIKIAAIREGMSLMEYVVAIHDAYQKGKNEGA